MISTWNKKEFFDLYSMLCTIDYRVMILTFNSRDLISNSPYI